AGSAPKRKREVSSSTSAPVRASAAASSWSYCGVNAAGSARTTCTYPSLRLRRLWTGRNVDVGRHRMLLWIIVLLLVLFAIGGGAAVNSLLWLLLIVALVVAIVALVSGRRAV